MPISSISQQQKAYYRSKSENRFPPGYWKTLSHDMNELSAISYLPVFLD
jgi:hypothetical protein